MTTADIEAADTVDSRSRSVNRKLKERELRVLAAVVVPPHLSVSGGARAAEQLSAALAAHCRIQVASMMNGGGTAIGSSPAAPRLKVNSWLPPFIPWSRLSNRHKTLFYRSDLPAIVRAADCDLVHIHNPMPALEMARVARACSARGIPYVVSTHGFNEIANGGDIYGFDALRRQIWQRLVIAPVKQVVSGASGIFALSPADIPIAQSMGFRGESTIVCNGVVLPGPSDAASDRSRLGRLGISSERTIGQITCMFLANHTPNKGLPVLLEAFAKLTIPYLLIIGGETRPSIDYDRYVRTQHPDQRIVVTGRLSDNDVAALFRRSDLFIFPTLADTFPLAVLEAMSHGLPVLASRVGGIPHQIDSSCGLLVEPGSATDIARAVAAVSGDPAHLEAMGRKARARVAAKFTWECAADQAMAGYARILAAKPSIP